MFKFALKKSLSVFVTAGLAFSIARDVQSQQLPLDYAKYDTGLFTPVEDQGLLSETEFTTLAHPVFPRYNVRIKKSNFCDGTVRAFTGYIDIQARHLFFYFFESRSNPDKDPVVLWTNGGPGCSSSLGLFMELGPCRVTTPDNSTFHPYSWNEHSNIFFIDQPVGVGFSYAEYDESVSTSEDAAKDIAAFVAIFFEHFSQYKGREFHMAGESYGGRYVPTFASEIYDQNEKLRTAGLTPINLASIMIGNGCTDWLTMLPSYYDVQCSSAIAEPISTIGSCIAQKRALARCKQWLKQSCYDTTDPLDCSAAFSFCEEQLDAPFYESNRNRYDISKPCSSAEMADSLCYPIIKNISAYLDRPEIRLIIGVDPSFIGKFRRCSEDVGLAFVQAMDMTFPAQYYIAALLERGVRALIFVGVNDWSCNWIGNERMTLALEWTGQDAFAAEPLRNWTVDGQTAGLTRGSGGFSFVTVDGAGHMVPYDKPKESLELVRRWLAKEEL